MPLESTACVGVYTTSCGDDADLLSNTYQMITRDCVDRDETALLVKLERVALHGTQ